jgi:hypothetical protein
MCVATADGVHHAPPPPRLYMRGVLPRASNPRARCSPSLPGRPRARRACSPRAASAPTPHLLRVGRAQQRGRRVEQPVRHLGHRRGERGRLARVAQRGPSRQQLSRARARARVGTWVRLRAACGCRCWNSPCLALLCDEVRAAQLLKETDRKRDHTHTQAGRQAGRRAG